MFYPKEGCGVGTQSDDGETDLRNQKSMYEAILDHNKMNGHSGISYT